MSQVQYSLVGTDEQKFITVFVKGSNPVTADDSHPNFDAIVAGAIQGNAEILDLFDVAQSVSKKFERLSERVSVANGRVYFDGDEVDDSLTKQIVRFLNDGVNDWRPLVAFLENIASNPEPHSREQLFDWLRCHEFTITRDGYIVGYKGVHESGAGLVSGSSGTATVNGQEVVGQIPNAIGSIIEMPRSAVAHDPSDACSTGLHVGTFEYAKGFARGAMLKVYVNPRDVVSVPTDASGEKVRVCRYQVIEVIDAPETAPYDDYEYDEYDYSDGYGHDYGDHVGGD